MVGQKKVFLIWEKAKLSGGLFLPLLFHKCKKTEILLITFLVYIFLRRSSSLILQIFRLSTPTLRRVDHA